MVATISGNLFSSSMQVQQTNSQQSMTQDQRQLIEDTLSKYDAENLTQVDASAIVEAFSAAGIQPGRELAGAMAEFGFDAKSVGDLAGVGGSQPPAAQTSPVTLNISDAMLQQLNELLSDYYSEDLSESDRETTLSAIKEIFQESVPDGGLVNVYA